MRKIKKKWLGLLLFSFFIFHGCAALTSRQIASRLDRPPTCQEFFNRLDEAVGRAGVRDASSFQVVGFPYLRIDRFLAAMGSRVKSEEETDQWLNLMRQMDLEAREKEISNLPDVGFGSQMLDLASAKSTKELIPHVESCSSRLLEHDRSRPEFLETLHRSIHVPDEYSLVLRTVGLYPITSIPMDIVSEKVRRKFRAWYGADMKNLPVWGTLKTFAPPEGPNLSQEDIKALLDAASMNPLHIPLPPPEHQEQLVKFFAPVYVQDVVGPYDFPGRVMLQSDTVTVAKEKPTVYYYLSHALLQGRPILQINYVIWYAQRTGPRSPWMERGDVDGLTLRVSLDTEGRAFMVDLMNNCGCYHAFIPRKERVERIKAKTFALDPFVPQWLPDLPDGARMTFRINSGWHQVERLFAQSAPQESVPYELAPYRMLEALPQRSGPSRSIFNSDGILTGSERIEPIILFSSGIHSIGAMRQRGHHAIEITGRGHFDDPLLFDESFVFK